MRKATGNILFIASFIAYMIVISGFISSKESLQKIGDLKITITDSTDNQFIRSADIRDILEQRYHHVFGQKSGKVNLEEIEKTLRSKQIINKAEAFITEPGVLRVEISQKIPFVRIFNRYGQGYYLDKQGNLIPLSHYYSPLVIVANGNIAEPFSISRTLNINDVKHDSLPSYQKTIYNVFEVADFITRDEFWNAQIEQIYVNDKGEFELIPRVGSHVIELGTAENLDEKFANLKLIYFKGFNNIGWNQYEKISLKYKNQVVCTKIQ
jgi:cell division protein FtsQ